jgi:hypothetical protein
MASTVATTAPASTQFSSAVSLPPELLLQSKAAHCSALRSGSFRYLIAMPSGAANRYATGTFRLDAPALTLVDTTPAAEGTSGDTGSFTPIEGQPCRFNTPNGTMTVAGSGALIFNTTEDGVARVGIALPVQSFSLALSEGTWNGLGQEVNSGVRANRSMQITFNASGLATAWKYCADITNCAEEKGPGEEIRLQANTNGGFDLAFSSATEQSRSRAIAFRPGGGVPLIVELMDTGEFVFWTRERTLTLPTVTVTVTGALSRSWNHTLNNNLTAAAVSESANTIVATDAATGRYQRDAIFNFTTGATQRETLVINDPRNGYTRRLAETVTGSDGSTRNVGPWVLMSLPGAGFTPVALQTPTQGLIVSVGKTQ